MTRAGQKTIDTAKKNGNWANPVSAPANLTMPAELGEQLKRNKKAEKFFASLAPSYQRQFVDWIATAKRPDTRQRRLKEAITLLKRGAKLGMR